MSFRLWTIFYIFALAAAAMATFGPLGGIVAAVLVVAFWACMFYLPTPAQFAKVLVICVTLWMIVGLLLPAMQAVRGPTRINQCSNNLKQLALSLLAYESKNGTLPPAYIADANGNPMHSWRVLILPYLEEQALYQRYNFNEPWNGPNNSKLAALAPQPYRCPTHGNDKGAAALECHYFAVVSPETGGPDDKGGAIRDFQDGTSNTILLIEASELGIQWMEPRDISIDEAVELLTTRPRSGHRRVRDGFLTTTYYEPPERNVAFCDGRIVWMVQLHDADIARALLTAAGGETNIPWDPTSSLRPPPITPNAYVTPQARTVIKWGKLWGLTVFAVLALLPAAWLRQRRGQQTSPQSALQNTAVPSTAAGV